MNFFKKIKHKHKWVDKLHKTEESYHQECKCGCKRVAKRQINSTKLEWEYIK